MQTQNFVKFCLENTSMFDNTRGTLQRKKKNWKLYE